MSKRSQIGAIVDGGETDRLLKAAKRAIVGQNVRFRCRSRQHASHLLQRLKSMGSMAWPPGTAASEMGRLVTYAKGSLRFEVEE